MIQRWKITVLPADNGFIVGMEVIEGVVHKQTGASLKPSTQVCTTAEEVKDAIDDWITGALDYLHVSEIQRRQTLEPNSQPSSKKQ